MAVNFIFSSNTFHILRPARAPGFAFAWLELISHRVFIGRMLALTPQQRVSRFFFYTDTNFTCNLRNMSINTYSTIYNHNSL